MAALSLEEPATGRQQAMEAQLPHRPQPQPSLQVRLEYDYALPLAARTNVPESVFDLVGLVVLVGHFNSLFYLN